PSSYSCIAAAFVSCHRSHPALHSFPTRRSSDLGIVMYELLTGQLPFESDNVMELVHSHIARRAVPPSRLNPAIPDVLGDIVLKLDRKSTRLNSSHVKISYAVFCLKKKKKN